MPFSGCLFERLQPKQPVKDCPALSVGQILLRTESIFS